MLINYFVSAGVDPQFIAKKNGASGVIFGIADSLGKRMLTIYPGANSELTITDLPDPTLFSNSIIHLSSFVDPRQRLLQETFVASLPALARVSFAPGMLYCTLGLESLLPILKHTDVLFLTEEELSQLLA